MEPRLSVNRGSGAWFFRSKYIVADGTGANSNADFCDFLSNGFKIKVSNASFNQSGSSYLYMAFAEAPLVGSNNIPCTAR